MEEGKERGERERGGGGEVRMEGRRMTGKERWRKGGGKGGIKWK